MTEKEFLHLVEPLKSHLERVNLEDPDMEKGYLPFVIVITSELVSTIEAMTMVNKDGQAGITKLFPLEPTDFTTITDVSLPNSKVYLLLDIDRGKESLNVRPSTAIEQIAVSGRSPLTMDEGIAIVTHYPEFLIKNNCFSLLASRHIGDQRVPAIRINGNKNPNLGWCWNGNPHTWLGSASCQERVG